MGQPVAKRAVCYNNILVNDPDRPDGPAWCKEDGLLKQYFGK